MLILLETIDKGTAIDFTLGSDLVMGHGGGWGAAARSDRSGDNMATKRTLVCDVCGKEEKKDCTGWFGGGFTLHVYSKKGYWWSKDRVNDDWYMSKDFCSVKCLDKCLNGIVLDGTIAKKAFNLTKRQNKEKKKKKKK